MIPQIPLLRSLLVIIVCAALSVSLALTGASHTLAQTEPATPTPSVAVDPTVKASPPCAVPCLVSVAVSGSPVYQLASLDSPKLASFASEISLYAIGMDATTGWIELQIAPYTTAWIERSNLSEPKTLASLPVVATPLPIIFTPTPASLQINPHVSYNEADKSIKIGVGCKGFRNNELVRFELYNPSGRLIQKATNRANVFTQVGAAWILGKYTPGTYKIIITRDDGAVIEKTVTVKAP